MTRTVGLHPDFTEPLPTGLTHVRIWDAGAAWCQIHTAPGVYNWDRLDELVAKSQGKHVTYVISGCPRWAAKYPDQPHAAPWLGPGTNSVPFDLRIFYDFVGLLASRYKGKIQAYEVWNEPQLVDFLYPYTTAQCNALALMTERAYEIVKAADPAAFVLAASVLPRKSSGGMRRARRYLRALRRRDWPVDAMTCHIYPEVGRGAHRWAWMLRRTVAQMRRLGAPSRLWITETTYGLLGPVIPEDKARQLVADTYAAAGGKFLYWYAANRPDLGGLQVVTTVGTQSAAWLTATNERTKQ